MNKLDVDYINLCKKILNDGIQKEDRTGTGTISLFDTELKYIFDDLKFPLLTTKKMAWKSIVAELIWFLRGDTNIKFLVENNCFIWNGDAYKNYQNKSKDNIILNKDEFVDKIKQDEIFSEKWGELGDTYGKQWRDWNGIDQIERLINDLKNNPDSRRLMVNAWNVSDIDALVLPPCHYNFQCYSEIINEYERQFKFNEYVRINNLNITGLSVNDAMEHYKFPLRKLSLKFNMRSVDVPLGLPFNIASYGLLLEILCSIVNMIPYKLSCSMGDSHIYKNQKEGIVEQLKRVPFELPKLIIHKKLNNIKDLYDLKVSDFEIIGYKHHDTIKMPLSN
jgi:thymidylate synthase